jgi:hypothetical protein
VWNISRVEFELQAEGPKIILLLKWNASPARTLFLKEIGGESDSLIWLQHQNNFPQQANPQIAFLRLFSLPLQTRVNKIHRSTAKKGTSSV